MLPVSYEQLQWQHRLAGPWLLVRIFLRLRRSGIGSSDVTKGGYLRYVPYKYCCMHFVCFRISVLVLYKMKGQKSSSRGFGEKSQIVNKIRKHSYYMDLFVLLSKNSMQPTSRGLPKLGLVLRVVTNHSGDSCYREYQNSWYTEFHVVLTTHF